MDNALSVTAGISDDARAFRFGFGSPFEILWTEKSLSICKSGASGVGYPQQLLTSTYLARPRRARCGADVDVYHIQKGAI